MSSSVPHRRPSFTTERIKTSLVPGAPDWLAMGDAANWINGHGKQVVPFCSVNTVLTSGDLIVQSTISFSRRAVGLEVFATFFAAEDSEVTVEVSGTGLTTTTQTVVLYGFAGGDANGYAKLSVPLTGRQNPTTTRLVSLKFTWVRGTFGVVGYGAYEQTRATLDQDTSTDYGVETTSLHSRRPIADFIHASAGGLIEAYKNLDARRTGYFSASVESVTGLALTATTQTDLMPVYVTMQAPIDVPGATVLAVTFAFKALTNVGTATIFFDSTIAGDSVSQVIDTTTTDYSVNIDIATEDFSVVDGRRGSAWEELRISYQCSVGTTLRLHHLTVLRTTRPI